MALLEELDDLPHGLSFEKKLPSNLLHDVIAVGATWGNQAPQVGRARPLRGGWIAPDRFACDPGADGQRDHLPAACFEDLPSTGSGSWFQRRIGKVHNGRLRKQCGAGGLEVEFSTILF